MLCLEQLRRLPARGSYDKSVVHGILDEALFCTVSYTAADGTPFTMPTNFVRAGESLFVHGKGSAAWVKGISSGGPVCVTVTLVHTIVYCGCVKCPPTTHSP